MADENRATETDDLLDRVDAAVEAGDRAALDAALEPMHPADIADLIERLTPGDRRAFLTLYADGMGLVEETAIYLYGPGRAAVHMVYEPETVAKVA